jgi:putative oxidoreductase
LDLGLPKRFVPYLLSLLRVVAALLFLEHGTEKLLDFPSSNTAATALSIYWFAGLIETIGGSLFLVGLFTRPAAFIMSGEMAVAYWMMHARISPFPTINNGDAAVLFCFIFLFFAAAGGGPWSADRLLSRSREGADGA